MNLKYAIQVKKTGKWLNLDFHDGSEIITVNDFTKAYHFDDSEAAEKFLSYHRLDKGNHEMFKLEVFARPIEWS
jgi:hypothetical protein